MNGLAEDNESSDILKEKGIYFLFGNITTEMALNAISFILEMNYTKTILKHLTFVVNSPGGSLCDGFAIIDAMRASNLPVRTVGIGQIASCGLLIFMAGQKGNRLLTKNTSILSHQWTWGAWGKEHELISTTYEYNLTTDRIVAHYKSCTGMSEKTIKEKLLPESDVWLSAAEAKKYGICDQIKDFNSSL
jgi:ATP-dependent Clp protease protease subunit